MKILVTAGTPKMPLADGVFISMEFDPTTGHEIAEALRDADNDVVLLTSDPDLIQSPFADKTTGLGSLNVVPYKSFEDLERRMKMFVTHGKFDMVVHTCVASPFLGKEAFVIDKSWLDRDELLPPLHIRPATRDESMTGIPPDRMFIELIFTEKLVIKIRGEWGYTGLLVSFCTLRGIKNDQQLLDSAFKFREEAGADIVVPQHFHPKMSDTSTKIYMVGDGPEIWSIRRQADPSGILEKVRPAQIANQIMNAIAEITTKRASSTESQT